MCCQLAVNETAVKAVGRCSSLLPPPSLPPPPSPPPSVLLSPPQDVPTCNLQAKQKRALFFCGISWHDQRDPGGHRSQFTAQSHSPSPSTLNPIEAQLQWGSTGEFPLVKWQLDFSGRQRPMSAQGSWSSA